MLELTGLNHQTAVDQLGSYKQIDHQCLDLVKLDYGVLMCFT